MEINYESYLDGEMWPSESLGFIYVPETGEHVPSCVPVFDMVPQKAVAALHKLIRWAHSLAIDEEGEAKEEARVRQSTLGRLLARKALRVEDFELYSEHGVQRQPLSNQQVARVLALSMLNVTDDSIAAVIPPKEIGQLASDVAVDVNNSGYLVFKEEDSE